MANTFKFGSGNWAHKDGKVLAYNDENNNFKPLPFDFTRASSATRVNKAGLIETVASGIPRVDYLNDANGALLLEPSRTNSITYSEDLTATGWHSAQGGTGISPIRTANYGIAPDGNQTATRVQFDLNGGTSSSDISYIAYYYAATGVATTNSVYMKSLSETADVRIRCGGTFKEVDVTTEWQRFDITDGATSDRIQILLYGNLSSQSADLLIWGVQAEQGSYATSYIPTSGSSVTRAADDNLDCFSLPTGIAGLTEGTMYVDIQVFDANAIGNRNWISLDNVTGGSDDRILIYMLGGASEIRGQIKSNLGANLAQMASSPVEDNSINKIAIAYKNNYCRFYVNGTSFNPTDSYTLSISNLQNIRIPYTGTNQMKLRDFRLYNTALTDSELIALTS